MINIKGIANIGNTCCLNTALQCMLFTPMLRKYILNLDMDLDSNGSPSSLLLALQDVFRKLVNGRESEQPVSAKEFIRAFLTVTKGILNFGSQWDLNETWTLLIDHLSQGIVALAKQRGQGQGQDNCNNYHAIHILDPQTLRGLSPLIKNANDVWTAALKGADGAWARGTHGLLIGQMQCMSCKYTCHNIEPFTSISLPIRESREPVGLNDCFFDYFKTETIDEWKCDKCKIKQQSEKLSRFWCASDVLAIHIKRFGYDTQGRGYTILTPLSIPMHFTINQGTEIAYEKQKGYRLCAIGLHYGGLQGGHYVALCRTHEGEGAGGGAWVIIDDDRVTRLSQEELQGAFTHNRHAYMLFYERDGVVL